MNALQRLLDKGLFNRGGLRRFYKDDPGQAQGDPGTPPSATPAKEDTYEIVVNGEKKAYTIEELKERASKADGADEKFRKASELKEEATKGLRINTLFGKLNQGAVTEAEAKELAGLVGVPMDTFLEADDGGQAPPPAKGNKKITIEDLDPNLASDINRMRGISTLSEQSQVADARKKIEASCREAVDKDKVLGKMISEVGNAEDQEAVRQALSRLVLKDVRGRILAREEFGTEMLEDAVRSIRVDVQAFGIPAKASKEPIVSGLGSLGTIPAEVYGNDPIKRVASNSDKYEENFVARTLQKLRLSRQK